MKTSDILIIIFAKNPVLGKVKTRLAMDIGDERALDVYHQLLGYTHKVLSEITGVDKKVFYSDHLEDHDIWSESDYAKGVQQGQDLGQRMCSAFEEAFMNGYKKVLIIGTDCFEINTSIVQEAIDSLNTHDFTLGPALDGGYYLLGMRSMTASLFEGKVYSTDSVADEALSEIKKLSKSVYLLPKLSDIDYASDLDKIK